MRNMRFGPVRQGESYRALREVEGEGLVCKEQDAEYPLSRRRYTITALGEVCLEPMANAPGHYRGEVELFFRLNERASLQEEACG
jgi:DNA-binding PadR family transcriptional regulator